MTDFNVRFSSNVTDVFRQIQRNVDSLNKEVGQFNRTSGLAGAKIADSMRREVGQAP